MQKEKKLTNFEVEKLYKQESDLEDPYYKGKQLVNIDSNEIHTYIITVKNQKYKVLSNPHTGKDEWYIINNEVKQKCKK